MIKKLGPGCLALGLPLYIIRALFKYKIFGFKSFSQSANKSFLIKRFSGILAKW